MKLWKLAGFVLICFASALAQNRSREAPPRIAITFDDLPAHGSLPPGTTRLQVASKILNALHSAGVPPTYGFLNGLTVEQQPEGTAVLEAWRGAGQPLGNHSWSHMNFNGHSLDEFQSDIIQNEPVLVHFMKNEDWHWLRYPFLAEGDTPARRVAIRSFLSQRSYKIATVTMSFSDYLWTEPYARCKEKNDAKAIAAMEESFLSAADESISYYRGLSHTLYGRDIAYVLLLHIGALDAEMLPQLLQLYRSRGFQFVTLADAEADEFYRSSLDPRLPPGPDTLEAAMADRGLALPARVSLAPLLNAQCQ
jgi:peptidoglycan/xylan/chitin deacetylase (PgdA/CDA1 family)